MYIFLNDSNNRKFRVGRFWHKKSGTVSGDPKQTHIFWSKYFNVLTSGDKYFATIEELVEDALIVLHMETHEATYIRRMTVGRREETGRAGSSRTVPTEPQREVSIVSSAMYNSESPPPLISNRY